MAGVDLATYMDNYVMNLGRDFAFKLGTYFSKTNAKSADAVMTGVNKQKRTTSDDRMDKLSFIISSCQNN